MSTRLTHLLDSHPLESSGCLGSLADVKAVVLSGGQGTRLRPVTHSVPKQLIPIGGRSVLHHILVNIEECGIEEVAIVTSPESRAAVAELLRRIDIGLEATILIQEEPRGLADAFGVALPFVGDEPSLLYLGDCLLTGGVTHVVEEHLSSGATATILVTEVEDPSRFGIVELNERGDITRLVEKPKEPASDLAVVGVYAFDSGIADDVLGVSPSWRGELEITDAIQAMVDRGGTVRPSRLRGWWVDTGTVDDVLSAQKLLMKDLVSGVEGSVVGGSVTGPVRVAADATVRNSLLEGPLIVETGAIVEDSSIGPGTLIGPGAVVSSSSIGDSIVMEEARVSGSTLRRSIVGPRAEVSGAGQTGLSVVVGADAVVGPASQSG